MQNSTSFAEKLKAVVDKARAMEESCLSLDRIRDHIFAPGVGIAWKLFTTPQEREAFCESKQYKEVLEIMDRALRDKLR